MKFDLYYVIKELRYSGKVEEYEYSAGPFKSFALALDDKQERNADYGVDSFRVVKHTINADLL